MKVKELINVLKDFNQEAEFKIIDRNGDFVDYQHIVVWLPSDNSIKNMPLSYSDKIKKDEKEKENAETAVLCLSSAILKK